MILGEPTKEPELNGNKLNKLEYFFELICKYRIYSQQKICFHLSVICLFLQIKFCKFLFTPIKFRNVIRALNLKVISTKQIMKS